MQILRWCRAHRQLLLHLAHRHRLLLNLGLLVADGFLGARVTACKLFDELLVLRVACWLVLILVSGVASVVLAAAHISRYCANFPFEACFHSPPYPCVRQRAVASRECVPLLILRLEHSCFYQNRYQHIERVGGIDCGVCEDGVCNSVIKSVFEDLPPYYVL